MTERLCTKCHQPGLTGRNRVHDGCLASAGGGTAAAPVVSWWFDETTGLRMLDEARWAEVSPECGDGIAFTARLRGAPHGCELDFCCVGVDVPDMADETPRYEGDVDSKITIDFLSPHEAAFPAVQVKGGRGEDQDFDESIPDSHREVLAAIDAYDPADIEICCRLAHGGLRPTTRDEAFATAVRTLELLRAGKALVEMVQAS